VIADPKLKPAVALPFQPPPAAERFDPDLTLPMQPVPKKPD